MGDIHNKEMKMNKLLDTLYDLGIIALVIIYMVIVWPYILWDGLKSILILNKELKRPDLALRD